MNFCSLIATLALAAAVLASKKSLAPKTCRNDGQCAQHTEFCAKLDNALGTQRQGICQPRPAWAEACGGSRQGLTTKCLDDLVCSDDGCCGRCETTRRTSTGRPATTQRATTRRATTTTTTPTTTTTTTTTAAPPEFAWFCRNPQAQNLKYTKEECFTNCGSVPNANPDWETGYGLKKSRCCPYGDEKCTKSTKVSVKNCLKGAKNSKPRCRIQALGDQGPGPRLGQGPF